MVPKIQQHLVCYEGEFVITEFDSILIICLKGSESNQNFKIFALKRKTLRHSLNGFFKAFVVRCKCKFVIKGKYYFDNTNMFFRINLAKRDFIIWLKEDLAYFKPYFDKKGVVKLDQEQSYKKIWS